MVKYREEDDCEELFVRFNLIFLVYLFNLFFICFLFSASLSKFSLLDLIIYYLFSGILPLILRVF